MGRELTPNRIPPFTSERCLPVVLCGISIGFPMLSPCLGQIAHALLTRPPLEHNLPSRRTSNHVPARLACVKHAASVRPEPGSNSDVQSSPFHRLPPSNTRQSALRASPALRRFTHFYSDFSFPLRSRCIVFKDRSLPLHSLSLAATDDIIANTILFVNPFFQLF